MAKLTKTRARKPLSTSDVGWSWSNSVGSEGPSYALQISDEHAERFGLYRLEMSEAEAIRFAVFVAQMKMKARDGFGSRITLTPAEALRKLADSL